MGLGQSHTSKNEVTHQSYEIDSQNSETKNEIEILSNLSKHSIIGEL